MAASHHSSRVMLRQSPRAFAPSFFSRELPGSSRASPPHVCQFSSSPALERRPDRFRGVSPLRRTGPIQRLSVNKYPLPQPVKKQSRVETDEKHGLWGFFPADKSALATPALDHAHGRAWTAEELRRKSWEDLHSLWWLCMKEQNRIATSNKERNRLKAGFGLAEATKRTEEVRKTMRAIRHVLIERWYAWDDALKLAKDDETIDFSGDGPVYEAYKLRDEPLMEEKERPDVLEYGVKDSSSPQGPQAPSSKIGQKQPTVTV